MATLIGKRLLARHAAGETVNLDAALAAGWITQEEHDAALAAAD